MNRNAEFLARWIAVGLVVGMLVAVGLARVIGTSRIVEIRGSMPERGGWTPADLSVPVGEPLHLRLISDDVVHGFAIGQSDQPAIDLSPGQVVETTLLFERPGKYVYYCTRWCGLNHWRMRGTIEVTGEAEDSQPASTPLYVALGLDIDREHPAAVVPGGMPSASRGMALLESQYAGQLDGYLTGENYYTHAPVEVWRTLREAPDTQSLSDDQVWDLVAYIWRANTTPEALSEGERLYAVNCAACHGAQGAGDGVMADGVMDSGTHQAEQSWMPGHQTTPPTDFTNAGLMLGASPAVLQGKIIRGGMGTGMPYWGPIFTEAQTWALVDYLWTFQFLYEMEVDQ